jgi:hypothetical protein
MPEEVNIDWENVEWARSMAEANPGGISVGVYPAYQAAYPDWYMTFFVASEGVFLANIVVLNGDAASHDMMVICLLDHRQLPCTPAAPLSNQVSFDAGELQFLPVEVSDLTPGLHDFDVLVVRDPYVDIEAESLESRETTLATYRYSNLLVDGMTHSPVVEPIVPQENGRLDHESLFNLSPTAELFNELGLIPYWLEAEGTAGEMLEFYLHFNSGPYDKDGDTLAMMAFLNYEQVPLYFEGEPYMPLYVQREASTWQVAPVQIRLPDEPGTYEFIVAGRSDVFRSLEWQAQDGSAIGIEQSKRIRVQVNERD